MVFQYDRHPFWLYTKEQKFRLKVNQTDLKKQFFNQTDSTLCLVNLVELIS